MSVSTTMTIQDRMTSRLNKITQAYNKATKAAKAADAATKGIDPGASFDKAAPAIDEAGEKVEEFNRKQKEAGTGAGKTVSCWERVAKAVGLAVLAQKAFNVVSKAVDYASDLEEVQNVVDVTFGRSADIIDGWAKGALQAYGINEVSAKKFTGTMGAMLKSCGLTGDSVVAMSQDLVGLAGDMASFYNLDAQEAFDKIRAGISGETEPLKQLGINMSVANLEAYALSQGIKKSYEKMTQAEQVALRYSYLMSTTADAQGDFARTSGSWANQTRILSEGWTQFTGVLAAQFLPILTSVAMMLNKVISFLTENADTVTAVLIGLATTIGILTVALVAHKIATWLSVAANKALIVSLLSNPLLYIAIAIGVVIGFLYKMIQAVGGLKNAWEICKAALMVAWAAIKVAFFAVYNWFANIIDKLKLMWQKAGVAIANFMGDMKVNVLTILQNLINGAINLINKFIGLLNKIPGVNIGLIEQVTFATTAAAENEAAKQARADALNQYESDIKAAQAERDATYSAAKQELADATSKLSETYANARAEAAQSNTDASTTSWAGADGIDSVSTVDEVGKVNEDVSIADEDLKFMRDVAEMRYVQNFVTLTPTVSMNASISEKVDVDDVIGGIEYRLENEFALAAEGVYN